MNKEEAVDYMIKEVESIERESLATKLAVDSSTKKREAVNQILKKLKEVQIDCEN